MNWRIALGFGSQCVVRKVGSEQSNCNATMDCLGQNQPVYFSVGKFAQKNREHDNFRVVIIGMLLVG